MISINLKIPERDVKTIDDLVYESQKKNRRTTVRYDNRSDFIRQAVLELIKKEEQAMEVKK
jgi:Arc/MetJ-type ribon-helix-helix transcriptional regulator